MTETSFIVPTASGDIPVNVGVNKLLFILGRNGVGKSALVHFIIKQFQASPNNDIVYLPGSRSNYFDGDSLNMTAATRSNYESNKRNYDSSLQIRIRPIDGTSRNERAIYDLQAAELQYRVQASHQIEEEGRESSAIARLQSKSSPLDRVNRLLTQANLPIQTSIINGELKSTRDGNIYSISRMSDGERNSLILISDVISAKNGSIFLIDEPELHLHRAIIVPLLSALIAERPDCSFIISTHELTLANDHSSSQILLVRGCSWAGEAPHNWAIDILPNSESIPDDLRVDLLGSRQIILFIEGTSTSRDQPLYAILFPKASLRHRSSCTDVRRAVVGLRQVEALHHARAVGLVDNDSMDAEHQTKLLNEGVYALPVFSVESLYYAPEIIDAVAARQANTLGGDPAVLIATATSKALTVLAQPNKIEHLAARVAERQMRDRILNAMPDRNKMIEISGSLLNIELESPYPSTLSRINQLLSAGDLAGIIAGFPVRESGILGAIAQSLRFLNDADYEKAALAAISSNPSLVDCLKAKLGALTGQLE